MDTTESRLTPSNEVQSNTTGVHIRQIKDISWRYISKAQNSQGKKILIHNFCCKQNAGRRIN